MKMEDKIKIYTARKRVIYAPGPVIGWCLYQVSNYLSPHAAGAHVSFQFYVLFVCVYVPLTHVLLERRRSLNPRGSLVCV